MRTTISLDDRIGEAAKRTAAERGMSLSAFISSVLDDALKRPEATDEQPFRLLTVGGGELTAGVDLDRPRLLLVAEDEARYGED